jgi:nitroreductase
MKIQDYRKPNYPIDPIYIRRWSPRAFLSKDITKDDLNSLFEAARWAPSAANMQPWRFIVAKQEANKKKFLSFIDESNVIWCKHAPVLVAIVSKTDRKRPGSKNPTHAFDTGAAWGFLALEAARKGISTHAMGGFDRAKAKQALEIPDNYAIHAIVAIGYQGDKQTLPESLQQREVPSTRKNIEEFVFEGSFENR